MGGVPRGGAALAGGDRPGEAAGVRARRHAGVGGLEAASRGAGQTHPLAGLGECLKKALGWYFDTLYPPDDRAAAQEQGAASLTARPKTNYARSNEQ